MRYQRMLVPVLALVLVMAPATSARAQGEEVPRGPMFAARALQALIDGIQFGVIIAITSVGLSLIFGTIHLINFAHGEFVTIGASSRSSSTSPRPVRAGT